MEGKHENLKKRTKAFALSIITFTEGLPRKRVADIIAKQLARCGTSVGANYRSASRAKSQADFIAKMAIVEEEADESGYWLELLADAGLVDSRDIAALVAEADQLVAIAVASAKTARGRSR